MTRHIRYPEEYKIDTSHRAARELLKALEWLENRRKELSCEKAATGSGGREKRITCNALAKRIRRIKDEMRGGEA